MAGKRRRTTFRRKRRPTRRTSRKTYKRRRTSIPRTARGWKPFGNTRIARLTYCDNFTLDPGANSTAGKLFRANGLYDPDATVGLGHQPYGFDQLMAVYNRYVVLGSKITVTAMPSGLNSALIIAVKLSDNAALLSTTPTVLQEQPGYKYKMISNASAAVQPRITATYSARRMCVPGFMYNDQYIGTKNLDPADQWYFTVLTANPSPTIDNVNMYFNVRIDYVAKFMNPVELEAS